MAAKNPKGAPPTGLSNPTPPITTPPVSQEGWTLNAVVQLTASVGRLEGAVNTLINQTDNLSAAQDKAAEKLEKVERKMLVAASIVAIAVACGGFVANKAIDFGLDMAKTKMTEQAAPSQTSAPVTQPQK